MKLVIATIQPTKLRALKVALAAIGVERITVCDAQEYDESPEINIVRGGGKLAKVFRRVTLQIAVNDDFLEPTIATIARIARTGRLGNDQDGEICVLPLARAIEIASNTQGPGAI